MEELDVALAPLALEVEQQHAARVADLAAAAAEPFRTARPSALILGVWEGSDSPQ